MIYNLSCTDYLPCVPAGKIKMIFADPPDNIGLKYDNLDDRLPSALYFSWMEQWILWGLRLAPQTFWISYNEKHDLEIKYLLRQILKFRYPSYTAYNFIWRYTFGQHVETDCGCGYRPIIRLTRFDTTFNTDSIRVTSARMRLGDKRANPAGRVPDNVLDFPRVVGNATERRSYHPTQHPEALMERIVKMSTNENDIVLDLFGGTFTTLRVCKKLKRRSINIEHSTFYCEQGAKEHGLDTRYDCGWDEPPLL